MVFGGWHAVGEGDGERVECGLPSGDPACLAGAFGIEGPDDQVAGLEGGLLGPTAAQTECHLIMQQLPGLTACLYDHEDLISHPTATSSWGGWGSNPRPRDYEGPRSASD